MATKAESRTECSSSQAVPSGSDRSPTTTSEFYSLLDEIDSESIAESFDIGTYTATHDFANHLQVGILEGVNPSDSLASLTEKIDTHGQMASMAGSTLTQHTNDRAVVAVVRVLFELLHSPQLYHQRGVQRKRLEWIELSIVTTDATNLTLTRSVALFCHRLTTVSGGLLVRFRQTNREMDAVWRYGIAQMAITEVSRPCQTAC